MTDAPGCPEITGYSQRQIEYAKVLRQNYLNSAAAAECAKLYDIQYDEIIANPKLKAVCDRKRLSMDVQIEKIFGYYKSTLPLLYSMYIVRNYADAGTVIDDLRQKPVWFSDAERRRAAQMETDYKWAEEAVTRRLNTIVHSTRKRKHPQEPPQ